MSTPPFPTVLIVPGLRGDDADHWQSRFAVELADRDVDVRVVAPSGAQPSAAARIDALHRELAEVTGPVVLVAHSAGVLTAVGWAATHPAGVVIGALLVTPADVEMPLPQGYPRHEDLRAGGWLPTPRATLPFPSIVVASRNDPLGSPRRVAGMAESWGARLVDAGEVGHLNPAAGFGPWPSARDYLDLLLADIESAAVERVAG